MDFALELERHSLLAQYRQPAPLQWQGRCSPPPPPPDQRCHLHSLGRRRHALPRHLLPLTEPSLPSLLPLWPLAECSVGSLRLQWGMPPARKRRQEFRRQHLLRVQRHRALRPRFGGDGCLPVLAEERVSFRGPAACGPRSRWDCIGLFQIRCRARRCTPVPLPLGLIPQRCHPCVPEPG